MDKGILWLILLLMWLPMKASGEAPASIILQARTIAGQRDETETDRPKRATRTTTTHGTDLEITIGTLGAAPEEVTVRWFWVGRYESSNNYFRSGDGEKAVTVDPKKAQVVIADGAEIETHYTHSKKGSYKSGGKMVGWVVGAYNGRGELIATKASDSYLTGFASKPPPKQRKAN